MLKFDIMSRGYYITPPPYLQKISQKFYFRISPYYYPQYFCGGMISWYVRVGGYTKYINLAF